MTSDTRLILAPAANGTTQVHDVVVGGTTVVERGGITGMVKVAAAPGNPILVQAAGGVWQETGSQWRRIVDGTTPVYPG